MVIIRRSLPPFPVRLRGVVEATKAQLEAVSAELNAAKESGQESVAAMAAAEEARLALEQEVTTKSSELAAQAEASAQLQTQLEALSAELSAAKESGQGEDLGRRVTFNGFITLQLR